MKNIDEKDTGHFRNQSETDGRIGDGTNAGVRNMADGAGIHRPDANERRQTASDRNPDVRVGAKGVMHLDIGESICMQSGNDCS